jgi:hypothetical protein
LTPGATLDSELLALGITITLESPIYSLLLSLCLGVSRVEGLWGGVCANLVSQPLAFLVVVPLLMPSLGLVQSIVIVEIGIAWLGEAVLLWRWHRWEWRVLLGTSAVANAISLAAGLIAIDIWPR